MKTTSRSLSIKGVGFEFVEDGHSYYLDGKRLTGVTTVLGVIAKPMLIQWAANQAVEHIEKNLKYSPDHNTYLDCLYNVLQEAKVAHRKKKEEAGAKGTDVHAIIEGIIKHSLELTNGAIYPSEITKEILNNPQVGHFVDWAKLNKVRFLASEKKVFSRELFLGGTIDFICEIDGEVWIGDIKTSSGIYPEHFFQTAGYQRLMEDMAKTDGGQQFDIKGHLILNCRKDGSFDEKRSISNEDNLLAFMSALNLYRIQEKLKGNII